MRREPEWIFFFCKVETRWLYVLIYIWNVIIPAHMKRMNNTRAQRNNIIWFYFFLFLLPSRSRRLNSQLHSISYVARLWVLHVWRNTKYWRYISARSRPRILRSHHVSEYVSSSTTTMLNRGNRKKEKMKNAQTRESRLSSREKRESKRTGSRFLVERMKFDVRVSNRKVHLLRDF